jgi:hypothetical protein
MDDAGHEPTRSERSHRRIGSTNRLLMRHGHQLVHDAAPQGWVLYVHQCLHSGVFCRLLGSRGHASMASLDALHVRIVQVGIRSHFIVVLRLYTGQVDVYAIGI